MALYSKKEFAALCGFATNKLSVYIGRGKVVATGEHIDDTNPTNAAFLLKYKKEATPPPSTLTATTTKQEESGKNEPQNQVPNPNFTADSRQNLSYSELERQKKLADLVKTEEDTKYRQLQILKLQGQSIPTELVKEVVSSLSAQFVTSFKDGADNFIIEISKRKSLSSEDTAFLRGQLTTIINSSSTKAVSEAKRRIKKIANEFAEKKEIGEHD